MRYKVTIPYKEPTYERHTGRPRSSPYYARYEVMTDSEEEAIQTAIELFEKDRMKSGVRWARVPELENIKVELVS